MAAGETYEIDIKAAMPEGDSVSAKLDALSKALAGAESSADTMGAAVKQVSTALAAAKAASADADAALAAGNSLWSELEANANKAAKALEKANVKGFVPLEVKAQADATRQALDAYAATLQGLETTAADARTSEQALALFLGTTRDAAKEAAAAEAALAVQQAAAAREAEAAAKAAAKAQAEAAKEAAAAAEAEAAALAAAAEEQGRAQLDAAKAAERAAKEQEEAAARAAKAPLDAAKQQAEAYEKLRGSLAALPGPLGKVASAALAPAQGFQKLAGGVGASRAAMILGAAAAATMVAAVLALAAAVATATVKIAAWAVGLADANRNAELASEAFAAMNPALAGLDFAGLARDTGASTKELQALAKQLQKAGVAADALPSALRAAGMVQFTGGDVGEFIDSLKEAKDGASELAAATQTKLGGIVSRQLLGLDAQSERFQKNISDLFGGLDIDPVLEGMQTLVALFDKNTAAGQALQFLFETVFQPLIDQAKTAAQLVEAFYLGVMIGAMKLYIALKPTIKAVAELFGFDEPSTIDWFKTLTAAGEALAPVFLAIAAVVGGALAIAFGTIAAVIAAQVAIWYGLWKAIKFVYDSVAAVVGALVTLFSGLGGSVVGALQAAWQAVVGFFSGVSLVDIGRNLMLGLAQGITGAVGAVVSAVTNAVSGTIAAAKSALGIHSPSKVFAEIGDFTGQGFAEGIDQATPAAHDAVQAMASPTEALDQAALSGDVAKYEALQSVDAAARPAAAQPAAAPAAAPAPAAAGPSRSVTLMNPIFNLGAGTAKELATDFVDALTELLENDAAQAAGATANG